MRTAISVQKRAEPALIRPPFGRTTSGRLRLWEVAILLSIPARRRVAPSHRTAQIAMARTRRIYPPTGVSPMKRLFVLIVPAAALLMNALLATHALATERPEDRWNLADVYPTCRRGNATWKARGGPHEFPRLPRPPGRFGQALQAVPRPAGGHRQALGARAGLLRTSSTPRTRASRGLELHEAAGAGLEALRGHVVREPRDPRTRRGKMEAFLKQDPGLAIYRQPLADILRNAAAHARRHGRGDRRRLLPRARRRRLRPTACSPTPTSRGRR